MKLLACAACIVVCVSASFSQIPNNGFETWAGGEPDGWFTSNVPGTATPVTESATARTGSSALRGEVVVFPDIGALNPIVQSGIDAAGFQVSQRHATLTGYYQFSPVSGDQFTINVVMYKNEMGIGVGAQAITAAAGTYTQFSVDIQYITEEVPDTCIIQFMIIGPNGSDYHIGSWVLIDDLAFTGLVTGTQHASNTAPMEFGLSQNYPNPFNGITSFAVHVARYGPVDVRVYDLLGREVAVLMQADRSPGVYPVYWNSASAPSGMYLVRMQAGTFRTVKRVVLAR